MLIHCRAGAHRAGACMLAYAIMAYGLNPFLAAKTVTLRRPCTQVTGALFIVLTALHRDLTRLAASFRGADWSASAGTSAALEDNFDEEWYVLAAASAAPAAFF